MSEGFWDLGGGERVVLALGIGSGSIDNRPTVLSKAEWRVHLVHQLHVCLWQWSTQSLVHVPKWSEAELVLPHRRVELTVGR